MPHNLTDAGVKYIDGFEISYKFYTVHRTTSSKTQKWQQRQCRAPPQDTALGHHQAREALPRINKQHTPAADPQFREEMETHKNYSGPFVVIVHISRDIR